MLIPISLKISNEFFSDKFLCGYPFNLSETPLKLYFFSILILGALVFKYALIPSAHDSGVLKQAISCW